MAKALKKEIREKLETILDMSPHSIANRLSEIKIQHPTVTPAAAAQLLARKYNKSILSFLDDNDKKSLPSFGTHTTIVTAQRSLARKTSSSKVSTKTILSLNTTDPFVLKHVAEINKAYNADCYTATFILCRKVIENMVVEILRAKFPKERSLFEDGQSHRFLDFSVVLDNLFKKRTTFSAKAFKAIERFKQKATPFKNDANDKAHSLFHIASKKEIDDAGVQEIFQLLEIIRDEVGIII